MRALRIAPTTILPLPPSRPEGAAQLRCRAKLLSSGIEEARASPLKPCFLKLKGKPASLSLTAPKVLKKTSNTVVRLYGCVLVVAKVDVVADQPENMKSLNIPGVIKGHIKVDATTLVQLSTQKVPLDEEWVMDENGKSYTTVAAAGDFIGDLYVWWQLLVI